MGSTAAAEYRPTDLPLEWTAPPSTPIGPCTRLVIWDLGTIPAPWRAVDAAAHVAACAEIVGRYPVLVADLDARPDPLIAVDMLRANGISPADARLLLPRYLPALQREFRRLWARGCADTWWQGERLREVVSVVAALSGVVQSFIAPEVRGNLWRKLADTGLDRCLDREAGACGSDHVRRADLIDIARRRAAARHHVRLTAHDVVVFPPGHWLWGRTARPSTGRLPHPSTLALR